MGVFEHFPYANYHDLNLDWIIKKLKENGQLSDQVQADWDENNITSKAYIRNKPTIPAAQVQSDWNEADNTAVDYIKNKPTIPAAQVQADWDEADNTAVDYIKNKPTIPAAQVQADWNEADNTAVDYIKNKPTIPTVPLEHHYFIGVCETPSLGPGDSNSINVSYFADGLPATYNNILAIIPIASWGKISQNQWLWLKKNDPTDPADPVLDFRNLGTDTGAFWIQVLVIYN